MANELGLSVEELQSSYEGELNGQDAWLQYLLDKATRRLFGQCKGLRERVASGTDDFTELVKDVVLDAALRVIRNPGGMENESEGNYSYKLNKLVASGDLWFPDKDLQLIGCGTSTFIPRTGRVKATPGWADW